MLNHMLDQYITSVALDSKQLATHDYYVISVASSLPNNMHTSISIALLDQYSIIGLQFQTEK